MTDHDLLDRLLHDVARDRAGEEVRPPGNNVLHRLRNRGRARRRRRFRLAVAAAATVSAAGLTFTGLPARSGDTDRVDTVEETSATSTNSTTASTPTTPDTSPAEESNPRAPQGAPGAAVGAPASAYIGLGIITDDFGRPLQTVDGQSLRYLSSSDLLEVGGAATVVDVADGEHSMLWMLLASGAPGQSTVADAVDLPAAAVPPESPVHGAVCTSTRTDAPVVAAVATISPTGQSVDVMAAWTVEGTGNELRFVPLSAADARCPT